SGGSSGGYGSSGGSSGGWSTSMPVDTTVPMAPVDGAAPAPAPAPGPAVPMTSINSATLIVSVPADAKVYVNGKLTTSTGTLRRYVSNNLEPGFTYTYELRAERTVEGKPVTETQLIKVRAGQTADLAFNFTGNEADGKIAEQPAATKLTLHVPADAKVYLSGNVTRSTGEVREFTTTRLAKGQEWNDYTVRIEIERDGKTISKEEKLTLVGGQARDLSVDLDAPQLALTPAR
ncbi:MAG TPA: TIGR03000 domain-containing protein, partial [Pirellulales bacterium]|nr:TIGR03000 domain-containing protein [Pirellulales bacterium]